MRPARGVLLVGALTGALAAGCRTRDVVATLGERAGVVEGAQPAAAGQWRAAPVGSRFVVGDAVRTGAASRARLTLRRAGDLMLAADTLVQFGPGALPHSTRFSVETGLAEIEASGEPLAFDLPVGQVRMAAGGRLSLRPQAGGVRLVVLVGRAEITDTTGARQALGRSDAIELTIGRAVIERAAPATRPASAPVAVPASAPAALAEAAGDRITGTLEGAAAEVRSGKTAAWQRLPVGAVTLAERTEARVPAGARLRVQRGDERVTVTGHAEFRIGARGEHLVEAAKGQYAVEATSVTVEVRVPGGVIAVQHHGGGARGHVTLEPSRDAIVVAHRGTTEVRGRTRRQILRAGETAILERQGDVVVPTQAPGVADLTIPAGESAVVHDQRGKTAVRVDFATRCPGEGRIEIAATGRSFRRVRALSTGTGSAIVFAARGANYYRVRCTGEGAATEAATGGTLTVRTDAGTAPLPQRTTHNVLVADGRTYTVLYQNRLPRLTFRWPQAPRAAGVKFTLKPAQGRSIELSVARPEHTLESGEVREGTYRWWFEAGARRSPESTLRVDFDNAAPTASIARSPTDAGPNGKEIRGVVVEGWTVSINGKPVPLDRHHRFGAPAPATVGDEAITIRLAHAKHGVHYYLRRPRP